MKMILPLLLVACVASCRGKNAYSGHHPLHLSTKDTWDPERVLRIAKKISNSSSIIQTNINVLRDITPVYQDDCSQKSNDSVNYGCYMLKLPIPDIGHKSLMCGERAGTSFAGRMEAMIHPGEQPAPGTLAYHFCMANCPRIGGTGFSWIPLQIVGVEEEQKISTVKWDTEVYPAIRTQFEDFKAFGNGFLQDYDAIANTLDIFMKGNKDEEDIDHGLSIFANTIHFMKANYSRHGNSINNTIHTITELLNQEEWAAQKAWLKLAIKELREPSKNDMLFGFLNTYFDEEPALEKPYELMNKFDYFATDLERRQKSIKTFEIEMNAILKQCDNLEQEWSAVESKLDELVTAASVSENLSLDEKRGKIKHLYPEVEKMRAMWQDMVILSEDVNKALDEAHDEEAGRALAEDVRKYKELTESYFAGNYPQRNQTTDNPPRISTESYACELAGPAAEVATKCKDQCGGTWGIVSSCSDEVEACFERCVPPILGFDDMKEVYDVIDNNFIYESWLREQMSLHHSNGSASEDFWGDSATYFRACCDAGTGDSRYGCW